MMLSTTPQQRRPRAVVALAYMIVFGSGIYLGLFISEGHATLDKPDVVRPADRMIVMKTRNRNLMSETSHDGQRKQLRFKPSVENNLQIDATQPAKTISEQHHPIIKAPTVKKGKESPHSSQGASSTHISLQHSINGNAIMYDNLPFSKPMTRHTPMPKIYQTSKSIAGCLFIMDDTIRLMEWLAYHYTVLPLSTLMVAIDPKSKKTDRIMEILDSWQGKIDIKAYKNDTEWLDLPWDYGYSRNIRNPNDGHLMKWYREKKSDIYFGQVHKRRQNYFCVHCMRYMKEKGMDWTMITDSDEYLMFNYRHDKQENTSLYDSLKRGTQEEDIDKERKHLAPYRARLPAMASRATIADFIHQEKLRSKCIMFPGLQFTSYESRVSEVFKGVPAIVNPHQLVTLRHRKAGLREGTFSKTMIDVSQGVLDDYTMETNINVHVPNKLLCGSNGNSGSRKDYISSLFRVHHYRTGTWESFIERAADRRASMTVDRFMERNIEPKVIDDDIRPWIGWFIEKVGKDEATRLLVDPLAEAYDQYKDVSNQVQRRLTDI